MSTTRVSLKSGRRNSSSTGSRHAPFVNLRRNARSVSASICQERTRPISIIPFAIATHADKSPRPSSSLPSFRTRRSHAFLAAMARCSWNPASPGQGSGFLQHKVKEVDGRVWKKTNHDLDFLIVRDGVRYGVEVKNQLGYIDQTEFQIKLAMCVHFGIRPMFVTRAMPENYIYDVMRAVSRS